MRYFIWPIKFLFTPSLPCVPPKIIIYIKGLIKKKKRHLDYAVISTVHFLHTSPLMGYQNVVDATQFSIDLEAEVGECLRGGLHHILHLDTLGCHSQQSISNTLYLR